MFIGLLDSCVLWPSLQRDFLLSLAVEGMYRPAWSSAILAELEENERTKLTRRGFTEDQAVARAARVVANMRKGFLDAEVQGWEPLEGTYGLPDPDDEHVLAAAVMAGAGAIVTLNLKDFPADRVPTTVQILTPSEFAYNTVALSPVRSGRAVQEIAARSGRLGPVRSTTDVLDVLEARYALTEAVALLREALEPA